MRNLKRALSLTLASVMLLGMMVVGSGAVGYDDVDESNNVEAIEVLQEIEVMVGDERGFGPDRPVNRAEMAVVMGKLLNLDYNYYSAACPFNDVYDWARGYVGACYANKILSGRGDGIYDPGSSVTAVEAAMMLMRALGYFQYSNDVADGWILATVTQGNKIGIFDGVGSSADAPMTRNQVAQMVLNALQSAVVEPDGNTTTFLNPDGTVLATTGKVNYVSVTSNKDFARAISALRATSIGSTNEGYIVELGERLYNGDLKLYDGRKDDFGRPSRMWEYDGKEIGTYMKKELLKQEWTVEVQGKDLYDLLGTDTIKDYDFVITIDGVDIDGKTGTTVHETVLKGANAQSYFTENNMTRTNKTGVGRTGKGVLTQVFVDPDATLLNNGLTRGRVWVSVINTYLAKATSDYNEKRDEVSLDVYGLEKSRTGGGDSDVYHKDYTTGAYAAAQAGKQYEPLKIAGEDFAVAETMKKDDIVLVTESNGEIITVVEPQVISAATLSEFSKNKYVINDGTKYEYDTTIDYDPDVLDDYTGASATQQLKDTSYNLYLDPYGYLIGIEVVDAVKNYIFLTGIDQGNSNLNAKTSDAAGILTDGTFVNFRMNMTDSRAVTDVYGETVHKAGSTADGGATTTKGRFQGHALWNTWCTYTVDKDGVYTLTEVGDYNSTTGNKPAKAGQFADLTSNAASKSIDTKHVSLKGDTNKYVYGNDNSVYIMAEVKEVTSKNKIYKEFPIPNGSTVGANTANTTLAEESPVIVISGVDSMGTGVDNVKIETLADTTAIKNAARTGSTAKAYPGYIYTLFDNDGYVIAAVILGEDSGASKNLVYSHKGSVESERYNSSSDDWTWTRYVISNGEEILLTQNGDKVNPANSIYRMYANTWYEVTYKADGTVKDVEYAYFNDAGKNVGKSSGTANQVDGPALSESYVASDVKGEFVNHIEFLEKTMEDNSKTVLYEEVWGNKGDETGADKSMTADTTAGYGSTSTAKAAMGENNAPSLKGSTLYVDTAASKGFYVHKDVKSVLIQSNNGKTTESYGSGTADLEGFLGDLNYDETAGTYQFKISAILVDGRATVVVIHDWNATGIDTGDKDRNPGEGETGEGVEIYVNFYTDVDHKTGNKAPKKAMPLKKAASSTGRLVLEAADLTDYLPEGYVVDTSKTLLPLSLEKKGTGDGYAEADVQVKLDTKNLKLPAGYKYSWPADDSGKSLWEAQTETAVSGDVITNGVNVPNGATVTVKVPGATETGDASNFYIEKPGTSGANLEFITAAGTFDVEMTADKDLSGIATNKYSKITVATTGTPTNLNGLTVSATLTGADANLKADKNGNKFAKQGGTVTVTFTLSGADTDTVNGAVDATATAGGTTGSSFGTKAELFDSTATGTGTATDGPLTIGNTTVNISLSYALENQ